MEEFWVHFCFADVENYTRLVGRCISRCLRCHSTGKLETNGRDDNESEADKTFVDRYEYSIVG